MKTFGLAVSALIRDGAGDCLLIRRSQGPNSFAGLWETPGGKVDSGESFEAALLREVEEETGFSVRLDMAVGVANMELEHVHVVMLYMMAYEVSGEVGPAACLSDEHDEYAWLSLSKFNEKNLTPALRNILPALEHI